jgi:MYXO-CTERM domain-containing protein
MLASDESLTPEQRRAELAGLLALGLLRLWRRPLLPDPATPPRPEDSAEKRPESP